MYGLATDLNRLQARRPRAAWRLPVRQLAILLAALAFLAVGLAHAVQGSAPGAYERVTVQPGDTLWDIASRRYPDQDVRLKVAQIEQANRLAGPSIRAGQSLEVPSR